MPLATGNVQPDSYHIPQLFQAGNDKPREMFVCPCMHFLFIKCAEFEKEGTVDFWFQWGKVQESGQQMELAT